jgi:hypothetical protein
MNPGMSRDHPIIGSYRIVRLENWTQEFVDAGAPAFIRFDPVGSGEFYFGYTHGRMTVAFTERDGMPAAEWTWMGHDEMDPESGRGWAVLHEGGTLQGKVFFHGGDSAAFTARKELGKTAGATTP